ncbi:MAG: hypothetical protein BWY72_02544 [Bacteroidetes bacterium ADurb.Bin416]|nr:MAG: hypothetical protein BWY72_02544 [Bacteroidetes bacterium ADurb.Bin416]
MNPCSSLRLAYKAINSRAMSFTFFFVRSFMVVQEALPSLLMRGSVPSLPLYLEMRCRLCMLTNNTSSSLYMILITSCMWPLISVRKSPPKRPTP